VSVDSVDLSRVYLDWGMLNFELNGFKGTAVDPRDLNPEALNPGDLSAGGVLSPFRFIRGDALRFLPEAKRAALRWDLIILDPPTFSNSGKMRGFLDIRRDYRELAGLCLDLLADGGKLFLSVNARSFKLDGEAFPGAKAMDLTEKLRDEDFRGKRVPACWVMSR
jgi:23S rRNA G2069 N7-methylase RlmK/C1962 C5-methylase RlmI